MIQINLALRKQSASVASEGKAGGGALSDGLMGYIASMKSDARLDGLQDIPLKKIGLMLLVAVVAAYVENDFKESDLHEADLVVLNLEKERTHLQVELKKTEGYEEVRKSLEADEKILRTKIEVIQKLLNGRQVSPKILTTLSGAVPADVWLRSFRVKGDEIHLTGASIGFNAVSDFMQMLNESAYLTDVQLKETRQEKDGGVDVAAFELGAKKR